MLRIKVPKQSTVVHFLPLSVYRGRMCFSPNFLSQLDFFCPACRECSLLSIRRVLIQLYMYTALCTWTETISFNWLKHKHVLPQHHIRTPLQFRRTEWPSDLCVCPP